MRQQVLRMLEHTALRQIFGAGDNIQAAAAQQIRDVRVIPQTHRMMQQL